LGCSEQEQDGKRERRAALTRAIPGLNPAKLATF